jgi:hypothetical protein
MAGENDIEQCDTCSHRIERKGDDWDMLCPNCADALSNFLDEAGLSGDCVDRLIAFVTRMIERSHDSQFVFQVPTYYGHAYPDAVVDGLVPEFGKPFVPILIQRAEGLRLVLGSSDPLRQAPDIAIERRPNGWALFLHPEIGGDPSGYVYFIDDGRSFVVPDCGITTPAIQTSEWDEVLALVDRRKSTGRGRGES